MEKKLSAQYAAHQSVKRAHERLVAENNRLHQENKKLLEKRETQLDLAALPLGARAKTIEGREYELISDRDGATVWRSLVRPYDLVHNHAFSSKIVEITRWGAENG